MADLFSVSASLTLDIKDFVNKIKEASNTMDGSKKSLSDYRSDVAKLAQQYKQSGMTSSEAWKKAYSEIDKSQYNLGKRYDETGKKTVSLANFTTQLKDKILSLGKSNSDASNGLLNFGKASETTTKAITATTVAVGNLISKAVELGAVKVTGFLKDTISAGMNFDTAMSQVAATMGKSVDEIQNLRDFAKEMGATTKYSATESAEALNFMALAGYDAETSMKMLPNVMNLASAGAFSLQRASDMLTDTQTAMGLSIERTTQLVDEMAKAASTGNTSVEQLGDAFLTVGGLAKELNGGFVTLSDGTTATVDGVQELEIALTAMANAGVKGSKAGTHMRNMLLKLSAPTKEASEFFEQYGIEIFDAEEQMKSLSDIFAQMQETFAGLGQREKLAAISDIFNARDTASAEALLAAVEGEMVKIGDDIYSIGTAYAKWGDAIYDSSQGFEIVQSSWDSIGESILNAEGAAARMSSTQIENLSGAITLAKSAFESLQIAISEKVTPALTEMVKVGGNALSRLATAIQNNNFENVQRGIKIFMISASRIIKRNVPKVLEAVNNIKKAVLGAIADSLPEMIDSGAEIVIEIADGISSAFPELIKTGGKILTNVINGFAKNAPSLIPQAVDTILTIIDALTNPETSGDMADAGFSLLSAIGEGIENSIPILAEKMPGIVENIKTKLEENKEKLEDAAVSLITFLSEKLKEKAEEIKENAPEIMQTVADKLKEAVPDMLETAKEFFKKLGTSFADANFSDEDKQTIQEKIDGVLQTLDTVKMNIEIAVSDVPETVQTAWKNLTDTLKEAFDRVKESWDNLKGALNIDEFWESGEAGEQAGTALNVVIEGMAGAIAVAADALSRLISGLLDFGAFLSEDTPGAQALTTILTSLFSVIGAFIAKGYIEKIPVLLASLGASFAGIGSTLAAFGAFLISPAGLITILLALVGVLVHVAKTSENWQIGWREISTKWKEDWDKALFGENGVWTNIKKFNNDLKHFGGSIYDIVQAVKGYFQYLIDEWAKTWEKVDKFGEDVDNFIAEIEQSIDDFVANALQWGKDLVDSFVGGIKAKWDEWTSTWEDFGGVIYDLLHHSHPDKGLLKDDYTWMPDMMELFAKGIKDNTGLITEQAENAVESLKDIFTTEIKMPTVEMDTQLNTTRNIRDLYSSSEMTYSEPGKSQTALYTAQAQLMQNSSNKTMNAAIGVLEGILEAVKQRQIVIPIDTIDEALASKGNTEMRWGI